MKELLEDWETLGRNKLTSFNSEITTTHKCSQKMMFGCLLLN